MAHVMGPTPCMAAGGSDQQEHLVPLCCGHFSIARRHSSRRHEGLASLQRCGHICAQSPEPPSLLSTLTCGLGPPRTGAVGPVCSGTLLDLWAVSSSLPPSPFPAGSNHAHLQTLCPGPQGPSPQPRELIYPWASSHIATPCPESPPGSGPSHYTGAAQPTASRPLLRPAQAS